MSESQQKRNKELHEEINRLCADRTALIAAIDRCYAVCKESLYEHTNYGRVATAVCALHVKAHGGTPTDDPEPKGD